MLIVAGPTNFKASCLIKIVQVEKGKPAKRGVGIWLVDESKKAHIHFGKFFGKIKLDQVAINSLTLALEQALRLQKEKIELQVANDQFGNFIYHLFEQKKFPRNLQGLEGLVLKFPFFRLLFVTNKELTGVIETAEGTLNRK